MPDSYVPGLPGVRSTKTATPKIVFKQADWTSDLALGRIISGAVSRDPTNTPIDVLQAGVLMGKISASGKYAPSILGPTTASAAVGATSITVGAATALELSRRVGNSGTFTLTGPPSAAGTIQSETVTYSAVNTTTGVITCTATVNAYISGAFVGGTDGSQIPNTFVGDGYGIQVTDTDHTTNLDVQFPVFPIAGVLIAAQLVNWPTDTSLQAWIVTHLNGPSGGQFVFDYQY